MGASQIVVSAIGCATIVVACGLDLRGPGSVDGVTPDASPTESGASSGSVGSSGESIDPSVDGGSSGGDGGNVCPADPAPPGTSSGACPSKCNGGCANNICLIRCNTNQCKDGNGGQNLVCPPDYACRIECNGVDACDGTPITCPAQYACSVVCTNGNDACGSLTVTCGNASCSVSCANDTCSGMKIQCGSGKCTAACTGSPTPTLTANKSCEPKGC